MREILFRAKRLDNGEWVEGSLDGRDKRCVKILTTSICPTLRIQIFSSHIINPSTVCQFTGLRDKNGERIWEGDVLSYPDDTHYFTIVYRSGAFGYMLCGSFHWLINYDKTLLTRLGSIHGKEQV